MTAIDLEECGRCGSALVWTACTTCQDHGDQTNPNCPDCHGTDWAPTCLATPDWCNTHPLPGRHNTPRHTAKATT